jgi:dihydroorotate dehydrogenase
MPDWSYRTILRPALLALGAERSRRLATATLGTLTRLPFGPAGIDFLGHMRADERLRSRLGSLDLPGRIALGSMIDPSGTACGALARFGVGLIEVGPVAEQPNGVVPEWRVDLRGRTVQFSAEIVSGIEEVARNLQRVSNRVPICVRVAGEDASAIARTVARLPPQATLVSVEASDPESARSRVVAAAGTRPVLLRIAADTADVAVLAGAAIEAGAAGVWLAGPIERTLAQVRSLRRALSPGPCIVAGGVTEPEDAQRLLEAGADVAAVDAGLVISGPGLVKRCNEALLSIEPASAEPEPLSMEAARRSWFWALLLGLAMFGGGIMAIVLASTRVVLPYDESLSGMTRAQLERLNPRLLPFMAHDRASLAGTMLSIGIFYAALAWYGIRRGAHWAQATVIASATVGFLTFFFFLGFGYFDPFHAFVTAILTQFTLLCLVMQTSPPQPSVADWRESAAWRRGQWGQLLFIAIGITLTGAGMVISAIGCTVVFVETDLHFMRTTAAQLRQSYETLIPLVAHDRASLGGMLIANGIAVWLSAQWGFRAGARWLWLALAWGGNLAFACATIVHIVVGYHSLLHLAPAMLGWVSWNVALLLAHEWMAGVQPKR